MRERESNGASKQASRKWGERREREGVNSKRRAQVCRGGGV